MIYIINLFSKIFIIDVIGLKPWLAQIIGKYKNALCYII